MTEKQKQKERQNEIARTYAARVGVPVLAIGILQKEGVLPPVLVELEVLDHKTLGFLDRLGMVWGNHDVIRAGLARLTPRERAGLMEIEDGRPQWEQDVDMWYVAAYTDGDSNEISAVTKRAYARVEVEGLKVSEYRERIDKIRRAASMRATRSTKIKA